jgi:hypothetical protein
MATNVKLKTAIDQAHFSYETLARKIQEAGHRYGQPNACNKATVARWLAGAQPHPHYVLLLEAVLNTPAADLGVASETYSMDREQMLTDAGLDTLMPEPDETAGVVYGELTGVWLSTYEYESSSRKQTYTSKHYVLLLQRGKGITVRSLPNQASTLSLELSVNGRMCTGNWTEATSKEGYYSGAIYSGAIQLEVNQNGDRLSGMWVGFGKNPGEFNTGPWKFDRVDTNYDKATRDKWDINPS